MAAALALVTGAVAWRLRKLDYFWSSPMTEARITRLTDFEGDELDAAISQDGKFVAFLSDRDGPLDAWVTQIGTGNFTNLTKGRFHALLDEVAFGIGFSGDGTHLWVRGEGDSTNSNGISMLPILGGPPRRLLTAVNVAWSPDGMHIAYFKGGQKGDTIFQAESDGSSARRIFTAGPSEHSHYLVWSPDGLYIYFVRGGVRLAQADVWRVPAGGGTARTDHTSSLWGALSRDA